MTKSVNLLVLCQLFYPELISTGQSMTELCEALTKMGIKVRVLSGPLTITDQTTAVPKQISYQGIHIERVWGTRFPKINFIGKLINHITYAGTVFLKLLVDPSKDPIFVLTNPPFMSVICAVISKIKKRKFIYKIADVYPDTAIACDVLAEASVLIRVWRYCNQIVFNQASAIIVLGRCMQKVIKKRVKDKQKIHMIHVWCDDKNIMDQSNHGYKAKWQAEDKIVIGYSGNMGRFHDMETLIQAAVAFKDDPSIQFVFIGEGHKKQAVMDYAANHQLSNCIFDTYVPREKLPELLNSFDIGLVSLSQTQAGYSVPSKTFGLMAAGKPIIAVMPSNSEIAKMIAEEDCGYIVAPGNVNGVVAAINALVKDKNKQFSMGKNAKNAICREYNLKDAAKKYYDIIVNL